MTRILYLITCLLVLTQAHSQIAIMPLQYDPLRSAALEKQSNLRVSATKYTDTLSLPFFEDFTSPNPSIDSIFFLSDGKLEITTLGHHGLQEQELISFTLTETEATYLNGNYYIHKTGKSSFILYTDKGLTLPLTYTSIPNKRFHGYWRRPGSQLGPNTDFTKWVDSGGVYVNNSLCISPPSIYVASFDGLNSKGNPYSGSSARGLIDNLTSLPLNLSGLKSRDNIAMSFYWQAKGYGFLPLFSDSLYLMLRDSTGIWNYAWGIRRRNNKIDTTRFYKATVKINDPIYFYNGFQFRFQAVGNTGAAAENWNLDYIYLDKNWDDSKAYPRDRAISQSQSPLLKNYQSMPYKQFIVNKNNELADTVNLALRNISGAQTIIDFEQKYIYTKEKQLPVTFAPFDQFLDTTYQPRFFKYSYDKNQFDFSGDSLIVKHLVSMQSSDPDRRNGIDFTTNNIDSGQTVLKDFFAYDDGSAEKTGGNIPGGPMLIKFTLNQVPDTLTAIDINFAKAYTFNNPSYSRIDVYIANKDKVVTETIKGVRPSYPGGTNNFTRAVPANGFHVITDKEFYVGYMNPYPVDGQNINIPIGMDFTYPQKAEVFFKNQGSTSWEKYSGGGNFMIRTVFGNVPVTGLSDAKYASLICEVFPNPSTGMFTITGDVSEATLYDISGKLMLKKYYNFGAEVKVLDASMLKNGAYILHLENEKQRSTRKLFIFRD